MKKLLVVEVVCLVLASALVEDVDAFFLLHRLVKNIYERMHPRTPAPAPFAPFPLPAPMPGMPNSGNTAPFSASGTSTMPGMAFSQTTPSTGPAPGVMPQPINGNPPSSQYQPTNGPAMPMPPQNSPAAPALPSTPQSPLAPPTVTAFPGIAPSQPTPSLRTPVPITPRPAPTSSPVTQPTPTTPAATEPESVSPTPPVSVPTTRPPVTIPPRTQSPSLEPEIASPSTPETTTKVPKTEPPESPSPPASNLVTSSPPSTPKPTETTPAPAPSPTTAEPTTAPLTPPPTPPPTQPPTPQPTPEPTPPPTEPPTPAPPPPTPPPPTPPPPTPPPPTQPPPTPPPSTPSPSPTPQPPAPAPPVNPGKGPDGNGPPGRGPGGNGPPGKAGKCGEEEKKVMYRLYLDKKKDYDECAAATGGYTFPFGGTPSNEQMASMAKSSVCKNVLKEFSKTITTECQLGDMPVRATAAKILYGTREDGAEDRDEDWQDTLESESELIGGESDLPLRTSDVLLSSKSTEDTTTGNVSNTVTGWESAPAKDQWKTAGTVHSDVAISSVLPSEINANLPEDADASASFTQSGQLRATTPPSLKANTLAYTAASASTSPMRPQWLISSVLFGVMYLFV